MMSFLFKNHLYCITSRQHTDDIVSQVEAMLKGGAKIIQYRDKEASDREFEKTARELLYLTRQFEDVVFLINDRVEIAAKVGADGVHVGWEDLERFGSVENVGVLLKKNQPSGRRGSRPPPTMVIGVSTHSVEQALAAEKMGADYIGIGPVFATPTKPDYQPIGLDVVRKVARLIKIPVVAIGGIDENNFQKVLDLGVEAVAMVRGVCDSEGRGIGRPEEVERAIRRMVSL